MRTAGSEVSSNRCALRGLAATLVIGPSSTRRETLCQLTAARAGHIVVAEYASAGGAMLGSLGGECREHADTVPQRERRAQ